MITFTIYAKPYGQKRPRAYRRGKFIGVYSPKENEDYKANVLEAYYKVASKLAEPIIDAPIKMSITAYFKRVKISKKELEQFPKKFKYPTKKPDGDNIFKAVSDGLNGVAYHDDSQIVDIVVHKRYDDTERVEVTIEEII